MQLTEIIKALEKSNFTCVAGDLKNHEAFIALKDKVATTNAVCCNGARHPCLLQVNDGYCTADACQFRVTGI